MWSWGVSAAAIAGTSATLSGSDGWLEGFEELHNGRALDYLDGGLLECDGTNSWWASPVVLVCSAGWPGTVSRRRL